MEVSRCCAPPEVPPGAPVTARGLGGCPYSIRLPAVTPSDLLSGEAVSVHRRFTRRWARVRAGVRPPSRLRDRGIATEGAQRGMLSVVDARTGEAHQVTADSLDSGRVTGRYVAVCGAEVLAASLTAPPTRYCRSCAEWMTR